MITTNNTSELTLSDLSNMDWQSFESFAVDVLRRYYSELGIDVQPTKYQGDGGRDGEAIYTFQPPKGLQKATKDLAIELKVWVEVKQKKNAKVDLGTVSGHVILADNANVNKLVLVTNITFAGRLVRELGQFCARNRISCAFVTGDRLLRLHRSLPSPGRTVLPTQSATPSTHSVRLRFSKSASPQGELYGDEPLYVRPGEPIFAIVDISYDDDPQKWRLDGWPDEIFAPNMKPCWSSYSSSPLPGEGGCGLFLLDIPAGTCLSAEDAARMILRNLPAEFMPDFAGSVVVRKSYLAQSAIASQKLARQRITDRFEAWLREGGIEIIGLRGKAGTGKSYLLDHFRKRMAQGQVSEILLDGEIDRDAGQIWKAIFDSLMPLSLTDGEEMHNLICQALIERGRSQVAAEHLAASVLRQASGRANSADPAMLAEILTVLLRLFGRCRALIIEDLHKMAPSGLLMLLRLMKNLRYEQRGDFLLVATSRPERETPLSPPSTAEVEDDPLVAMLHELGRDTVDIKVPGGRDAAELLQGTILGLTADLAAKIVDAVGTTPFALKEAVAFLEQSGAITAVERGGGRFRLIDLEVFKTRIRPEILLNVARERLRLSIELYRQERPWLEEFLLAGALIGRQFPLSLGLAAAAAGTVETRGLMADLFGLDLLNKIGPDQVAFSHDLLRSAVLQLADDKSAQSVAQSVLDAGNGQLAPLTETRLHLHAGNAKMAADRAAAVAEAAAKRQAHWDTLQARLVQLNAIDPDIYDVVVGDEGLSRMAGGDETLVVFRSTRAAEADFNVDRDRRSLELVMMCLECLARIGVGKRDGFEALVTEGAMLACRLGHREAEGQLAYYRGRIEFDQDRFTLSASYHAEAEAILALHAERSVYRRENLNRLFLCYRQMGLLTEAHTVLDQLERLADGAVDVEQAARLTAYRGYAQLYAEPEQTLVHWGRAASMAREGGALPRYAEHAIGQGYMLALIGDPHVAENIFNEVERVLADMDSPSTRVRLHLGRGVLGLVQQDWSGARLNLLEAARIGVAYAILRRLWRIDANLALVCERLNDLPQMYGYDSRCVAGLRRRLSAERELDEAAPWLSQRHALPLLNMELRARAGLGDYAPLLAEVPPRQYEVLRAYADMVQAETLAQLPIGIATHLRNICGSPRCLVTE